MAHHDNADATHADIRGSLREAHRRRLGQVERVLERLLARKDYGVCEDCGEFIGVERLRIMPFAPRCATCAARGVVRERPAGPAGPGNGSNGASGSSDVSLS